MLIIKHLVFLKTIKSDELEKIDLNSVLDFFHRCTTLFNSTIYNECKKYSQLGINLMELSSIFCSPDILNFINTISEQITEDFSNQDAIFRLNSLMKPILTSEHFIYFIVLTQYKGRLQKEALQVIYKYTEVIQNMVKKHRNSGAYLQEALVILKNFLLIFLSLDQVGFNSKKNISIILKPFAMFIMTQTQNNDFISTDEYLFFLMCYIRINPTIWIDRSDFSNINQVIKALEELIDYYQYDNDDRKIHDISKNVKLNHNLRRSVSFKQSELTKSYTLTTNDISAEAMQNFQNEIDYNLQLNVIEILHHIIILFVGENSSEFFENIFKILIKIGNISSESKVRKMILGMWSIIRSDYYFEENYRQESVKGDIEGLYTQFDAYDPSFTSLIAKVLDSSSKSLRHTACLSTVEVYAKLYKAKEKSAKKMTSSKSSENSITFFEIALMFSFIKRVETTSIDYRKLLESFSFIEQALSCFKLGNGIKIQAINFFSFLWDLIINIKWILTSSLTSNTKSYYLFEYSKMFNRYPDIKLYLLEKISKFNYHDSDRVEKAMSTLHKVALISDFLDLNHPSKLVPVTAVDMSDFSHNLILECFSQTNVISIQEYFSRNRPLYFSP
ncbi:MAG: hypothetical protein MHPSP_000969, partial [Paramarteilia canceri]